MLRVVFWNCVILGAWVVFGAVRAQAIPKTSFSCDGRTSGYYADVSTGCQVYHMCDGLGRQFTYRCPSKTLFQQRMLVCDHWYMVNCSKAEEDYSANLLIGQRGKPFVEDLQFHRTPRPDLIDPSNSDYNTYRIGHQETLATKNVVGADEDNDARATTDDPNYSPPAHWSTEIPLSSQSKRQESDTAVPGLVKQIFYMTSYNTRGLSSDFKPKGKGIDFNSVNRNGNTFNSNVYRGATKANSDKNENLFKEKQYSENNENVQNQEDNSSGKVNFPSSFKATTPVYPKYVDVDMAKFFEFANPLEEQQEQHEEVSVNFPSRFKATTPVYPEYVDTNPSRSSEFDIPFEQNPVEIVSVNFPSKFQATTPVYPSHVELDPSKLSEFDILPNEQETDDEYISINFPSRFRATTPVYPQHVDQDLTKFSGFEEIPPEQNSEENVVVNFASNFKATTPVYPQYVDQDLTKFSGSEEIPPGQNSEEDVVVNFASNFKATTPVYPKEVDVDLSKFLEPVELPLEDKANKNSSVNFASDFKATTPVYPQSVDPTSPNPDEAGLLPPKSSEPQIDTSQAENSIHVNFASNFQATTPNYPTSVEPTSPDPNEVGLVVPQLNDDEQDPIIPSLDFHTPNFDQTFSKRSDEYDPSVVGNTFNSKQLTEFMITMKPEQLRDLKELWHIPDYDFPLESASRPSYGSDYSSFQAKSVNKR